jgi:hypothetical protein
VPCERLKLDALRDNASAPHCAARLCGQHLLSRCRCLSPACLDSTPAAGVRRRPEQKHWFHRPTDEIPFDAFVERIMNGEGRSKNVDGAVDVLIGEAR